MKFSVWLIACVIFAGAALAAAEENASWSTVALLSFVAAGCAFGASLCL
jgi:uncharacterized membrane protein